MSEKIKIKEKELIDIYVAEQIIKLKEHNSDIYKIINGLGFASEDIEPKTCLEWDILICEISSESRALFNILEKEQADRMFKYLIWGAFIKYGNDTTIKYISNELLDYKTIIQNAQAEKELPDDFIYSKLISNILRENRDKYNIGIFEMSLIMQLAYIFSGKWKKLLDSYLPIE